MKALEIFIGSDHHGVALKEAIAHYLSIYGYKVHDVGTDSDVSVDYPHIAIPVARAISDSAHNRRGILLCGSGIGMCIVANRFKGVRAGQVWNEDMAARAKKEDDVNVLCLAADYLSEEQCLDFVSAWLEAPFDGGEMHARRLRQVAGLDENR